MNPTWTPPAKHDIRRTGPAVRFMEGALLGNGGLGVVVTTRPDAIELRLGHNDVWDERIDESHADSTGTFSEVLARIETATAGGRSARDDVWFRTYRERMERSYTLPYPRPYPCGHVVLGFDRRRTRLLGHHLQLANGVCTVHLEHDGVRVALELLVDQDHDVVVARVVGEGGEPVSSPFTRIRLLPDVAGPSADPASLAEHAIAYTVAGEPALRDAVQEIDGGDRRLVFSEALPGRTGDPEDQHRIVVSANSTRALTSLSRPSWYGGTAPATALERGIEPGPLELSITLAHDRVVDAAADPDLPGLRAWEESFRRAVKAWDAYWARSSVRLESSTLESAWYRNTYFIHCALRAGRRAPGIFGNWISGQVGTAWHGDYHMNYNTQQLYWGVFSSNRIASHGPYLDLVDELLPLSSMFASEYFELPGAYFPHSAYPVAMNAMPFPSPVWGWEISETPWTVQSLWWHFLFTRDTELLERRLLKPLQAATEFMVSYLERGAASGERWGDDRRHIYPTVVPELYELTPDLAYNYDCILDLTLTRFLFSAYREALRALGRSPESDQLGRRAGDLLGMLPDYSTARGEGGDVFVSVPAESPDVVYNIPLAGATVFPGEEHSWRSPPELQERAKRSIREQRLEGGNELVFANLQRARMGIIDVGSLESQLRYCELPNGTYTDMLLEVFGRYNDATPFDFMADMGVWVENFAITAVVNEMLLQSSAGVVRVFPNDEPIGAAQFFNLRASGAFLVSASHDGERTEWIEIVGERGGCLRIAVPDGLITDSQFHLEPDGVSSFVLAPGAKVRFTRPGSGTAPRAERRTEPADAAD